MVCRWTDSEGHTIWLPARQVRLTVEVIRKGRGVIVIFADAGRATGPNPMRVLRVDTQDNRRRLGTANARAAILVAVGFGLGLFCAIACAFLA